MATKRKKRKSRGLGLAPQEHLHDMSRYVNAAASTYERAISTDRCKHAGLELSQAQFYLGLAEAHLRSGGKTTLRQKRALDALGRKINEATFSYFDGPCLRKTAYGD